MKLITNLEKKVKLAKFVSFMAILGAVVISIGAMWIASNQILNSKKSIYILDANNIPLIANQTDIETNREVEYQSQIGNFHALFFNIVPDEKNIDNNMRRALYLVDESGMQQYNALKEKGYFNRILSTNTFVTVTTDSINVDMINKKFIYYGTQKIERKSSILIRSLVTEGNLKDMSRTELNAHGVLITNWKTTENNNLKEYTKNAY